MILGILVISCVVLLYVGHTIYSNRGNKIKTNKKSIHED
jgi:hypothetical protein